MEGCEFCKKNNEGLSKLAIFTSKNIPGMRFTLAFADDRITVELKHPAIGEMPVHVGLPINFCPMCGRAFAKEAAEE